MSKMTRCRSHSAADAFHADGSLVYFPAAGGFRVSVENADELNSADIGNAASLAASYYEGHAPQIGSCGTFASTSLIIDYEVTDTAGSPCMNVTVEKIGRLEMGGRYEKRAEWEEGVTDLVDGTKGWVNDLGSAKAIIEPDSSGDGTYYGYIYENGQDDFSYADWYETLDDAKADLDDQLGFYTARRKARAATRKATRAKGASRQAATSDEWQDEVFEIANRYPGYQGDVRASLDGGARIEINSGWLDEDAVHALRGILFDVEAEMRYYREASRKTAGMSLTKLKPLVQEFAQLADIGDYEAGYIYDFLDWAEEQSLVDIASRKAAKPIECIVSTPMGNLPARAEFRPEDEGYGWSVGDEDLWDYSDEVFGDAESAIRDLERKYDRVARKRTIGLQRYAARRKAIAARARSAAKHPSARRYTRTVRRGAAR